ncbi:MAG TPA: SsrA-binding protein SmpB [Candidatus Caccalectryoclostridium excrementigallinarum]|uniref:SsrA-binding protein n=1 Tax=Candidatus Caccalectryoclostridium excrementigallinarum TaxID=2840710 RepID=A0A9D1MN17_9FIRM|nr:SsrA-binding protein SmpB [Candidatus Caccalectryoclostridium excrementigallinarum]
MDIKVIDNNKKAFHDYFIEETYEAGIVLTGAEVKSVRGGHMSLRDSFVIFKGGQALLVGAHIKPYEKGSFFNTDAKRTRVLLLNKGEINKLRGKTEAKGYTVVPTRAYFKKGLVKVEVGLARGKEGHDKRRTIAERDAKRNIERTLKQYNVR